MHRTSWERAIENFNQTHLTWWVCSATDLPKEAQKKLSHDPRVAVRRALAERADLDPEVIKTLREAPERSVRVALLNADGTRDLETIEAIVQKEMENPSGSLLDVVVEAASREEVSVPQALRWAQEAQNTYPRSEQTLVRFALSMLGRDDLSEKQYQELNEQVKSALGEGVKDALWSPSTPVNIIEEELKGKDLHTLSVLAQNPALSDLHRAELAQHESREGGVQAYRGKLGEKTFQVLVQQLQKKERLSLSRVELTAAQYRQIAPLLESWQITHCVDQVLDPDEELVMELLERKYGPAVMILKNPNIKPELERKIFKKIQHQAKLLENYFGYGKGNAEEFSWAWQEHGNLDSYWAPEEGYSMQSPANVLRAVAATYQGGRAALLLAQARTQTRVDIFDTLLKQWEGSLLDLVAACNSL